VTDAPLPRPTSVRDIRRREDRGIYALSFFLPPVKREAAYAVLAFRRLIHSAIDNSDQPGDSVDLRLDLFRDRLEEIYAGRLELPERPFRDEAQHTLAAIAAVVRQFEIPKQHFLDLAEARRMELTVSRYATWNALQQYLDRAAGSIARVMAGVLGVRHSEAAERLATLSQAIQLTAILCCLGDVGGNGTIFLPLEDLARLKYSERQLQSRVANEALAPLIKFEIDRARDLYRRGAEGICWLADDGSRFAVAAFAVLNVRRLKVIEAQPYNVFARRPALRPHQQLACVAAAWRLARRTEDHPLPDVF